MRIEIDTVVPLGHQELEVSWITSSAAVAVVGPSGAGKTTLLRILAGVESRARGRVRFEEELWLDTDAGIMVPPWERAVGWVPQDALLFPHLSVAENLGYSGAAAAAVEEMAKLLGVFPLLGRAPRNLSGGERQRVAVGRALLSSPRVLLLDEPFSALDRPLRTEVSTMVAEHARSMGVPLVLVSHDEKDAELLAEERWHLAGGVLEKL
jgi:molybdate transport system ATP-binding protein